MRRRGEATAHSQASERAVSRPRIGATLRLRDGGADVAQHIVHGAVTFLDTPEAGQTVHLLDGQLSVFQRRQHVVIKGEKALVLLAILRDDGLRPLGVSLSRRQR